MITAFFLSVALSVLFTSYCSYCLECTSLWKQQRPMDILHERNIDVTLLKRAKGILWIFGFAQVLYIYISWYYCRVQEILTAVPWHQHWPWQSVPRSWPVAPDCPSAPHWPCTEPHTHRHTTWILTYPWKWTIFQWQNGLKLVILADFNQVKVDTVIVLRAQRNTSAILLTCNRAIMQLWPHGSARKSLH